MFAHIHESFLHDSYEFPAYAGGHVTWLQFEDKARGYSGFSGKALDRVVHYRRELASVHVNGLHFLHQLAQLEDFFSQQSLNPSQLTRYSLRLSAGLPSHDVYLHFHGNERLHGTVMQLTGDASAFNRPGAHAKASQQIDVVNGGANLANDLLQET